MKYAITGHTSGIGKALYENYLPNAIGFSRSNGFNISTDIRKIIHESKNCDVFINNAQEDFYQTELLYELSKEFKGKIINIGSMSKDWITGHKKNYKYAVEKQALDSMNAQLFWEGVDTSIVNLSYVDVSDQETVIEKLEVKYIIEIVDWIINQPFKVKEMSVRK
tara:strand:- start:646 stop:1140 length:495 start_codon:yes stop_codon:yes gene_type:complete